MRKGLQSAGPDGNVAVLWRFPEYPFRGMFRTPGPSGWMVAHQQNQKILPFPKFMVFSVFAQEIE